MELIFKKDFQPNITEYDVHPILTIIRFNLKTNDSAWVNRYFGASLKIRIACLNDKGEETDLKEEYLSFSSFISTNIVNPTFDINRLYTLVAGVDISNESLAKTKKWRSTIQLVNVQVAENETVVIDWMNSQHVQNRVDDWSKRITLLVNQIRTWLPEGMEIKPERKQIMSEGLMKAFSIPNKELETYGIYESQRLKIAIKPYGLFVMGANGRIDLLTSKGNFILVDAAEQFQPSQWKIYWDAERNTSRDFNKEIFLKLLTL
jgi:hypothetical protein